MIALSARFLCPFAWVVLAGFALAQQTEEFEPLFNGKDLSGWVQKNGSAIYRVEDGVIIGTSVPDSPNSFLCTERHFSDFILEFEFQVDAGLNSGVQIRSHARFSHQNGRVHGYQIEIDPSERSWTGGIYDEGRRGWLADLKDNEAARQAFRAGEWNRIRVEALGTRFRTFVNGVPCVDFQDDMTPSGFIGLQVHGIGSDQSKAGLNVRWRNIRICRLGPALSDAESAAGWRLLFDGHSAKGWQSARSNEFPLAGWTISGGCLVVEAGDGSESRRGGDIVTTEVYGDFDLLLEFRLSPGANSGIKYYVAEDQANSAGSAIGLEYQLLDDTKHPDASAGVAGNRTLGSLYDLIPAENKPLAPVGEWHQARIVSRNDRVDHFLNGVRVLHYERGGPLFRALVRHSKYKVHPGFGEAPRGRILLQDHGDHIEFRDIRIRTSTPLSDPWLGLSELDHVNVEPYLHVLEARALHADETLRLEFEARAMGVLEDQSVTTAGQKAALRLLRLVGGSRCVALVASRINNPSLCNMALQTLDALPDPRVEEILRRTLSDLSAPQRDVVEAVLKNRARRRQGGEK